MTAPLSTDAVIYLMELVDAATAVPVERARARDHVEVGAVLARWRNGAWELDPDRFQVVIDAIPRRAVA